MTEYVMQATTPHYDTTLDRAGLALGLGGVLGGLVLVLLVLASGQRDIPQLLACWVLGTLFATLGVAAVGGPLWLLLHFAGYRRPIHAALLGAVVAMVVFVGAQTYGFGLVNAPLGDASSWAYRWASAVAVSSLLAAVAAGIALAMWRLAYRRLL